MICPCDIIKCVPLIKRNAWKNQRFLQIDKISLNSQFRIKERTEFLISFLDLPPENRLVGKLSGGQQRRASLAAALLHEPELLILDEPTVGVDPLLRQCIWDHLLLVNFISVYEH